MNDLTKADLYEKLIKLLRTSRDLTFLLSLSEEDLTILLVAVRESIDQR
ncbi:MAG: hypothetical protein AB1558_12415 [Thermodesulfobacteriota bacterium]